MGDWIHDLSDLLVAVQVVMTIAVGVFAWYMRNAFVSRREFVQQADDISKRLTTHSERLVIGDGRFERIEERMAAMPNAAEVTNLKLAIERLSGDVRVLNEKIEGFEDLHHMLKTQVQVMDEFLRARP